MLRCYSFGSEIIFIVALGMRIKKSKSCAQETWTREIKIEMYWEERCTGE
jgi:hypothetical protein